MKIDVKMPKLGESLTEGTVLKWWKKVGESIKKDETLLEVSTDKVDSEIPSPVDGTVAEIIAGEQETVEVGALLARIETEAGSAGEVSSEKQEKPAAKKETKEPDKAKPAPEKKQPEPSPGLMDVVIPRLGESLTEGTILKWWKQPGEALKKDETLLEISTDKVDSEIPSPVDGVLKEILFKENETIEVGTVIARIETEGRPATAATVTETDQTTKKTAPKPETRAEPEKEEPERQVQVEKGKGSRFYSPLVLTIARKEGISMSELESISGSGTGGRVSKKDILGYIERRGKPAGKREIARPVQPPVTAGGERVEIIPMDNVRKKIAEHMRHSLDTSAHVYSVSECDMTDVMNLMYAKRQEFQRQEGFKLTLTPFILHATVKALLDYPRVNASLDGENIIEKKDINLGIAVASPRGLIVPVVKNAEEKSFRGFARSVNDLVTRTRDNKLTYGDIEGSTFSVTNYGIFGNIIGLPIINQPNVAILGIGAVKKRPVVIESPAGDSIAIRSICFISMSYDHRLVDGELGGRFMQRVVKYLENFEESSV
jgi:pyruvate dehydrogenase E2 component (dihydrolipoamide acetyltransferase)